MTTTKHLSIVIAVYNEEYCLAELMWRITAAIEPMNITYEVLLVNDGSTDNSEAIIRGMITSYPNIRLVSLTKNFGQCQALYAGISESIGKAVILMDADLQHAPEEIPLLYKKLIDTDCALVSGTRESRSESLLLRRIPSRIANYLLRKGSKCEARDMGGFKCLQGDIARSLRLRAGYHRFIPALVHLQGGQIEEVTISAPPRFAGSSKYTIWRAFDVFFDILLLWFYTACKARPLYLLGRVSVLFFCVATLLFFWASFDKLLFAEPMGSRPIFFISLASYVSSLVFVFLGIILEILTDTLNSVTGQKTFSIKKVYPAKENYSDVE